MLSSPGSTDFAVIHILIHSYELLDIAELFKSSQKKLNSEKFYDAMDMVPADLHNYKEECNKIVIEEPNDQLISICKKYLRFLDKSDSWSGLFPIIDVSLLLNYWIYDNLTHIYGDGNTSKINIGFDFLVKIWEFFTSRNYKTYYAKCMPHLSMVNHEDWKKRKELYHYCVDYHNLSIMALAFDENCKYYKIIEEKKKLYDHFAELCDSKAGDCPDFYNKCRKYNPDTLLSTLTCDSNTVQANASHIENTKETSTYHSLGDAGHSHGPADGHEMERGAANSYAGGSPQRSVIGKKVAYSVLGAAPVLLTATMLYRVCIYFVNIYHHSTNL
ncbi:CYIR protein [Plasmodium cynomolgi strain B]|uniref:CYIR protein n=1 Tax=Plasmodium cynomolgi (strain B) TaxID=1120755 RepID=K6VJW0_PLACD|nr:CYIR protein [Plasmodium cynomolgi strain B]GAB69717.1 CYIR protein [Plasmodium cynomolgi strain B]